MALYEKPVRVLMHDMVSSMGLTPGQVITKEEVIEWFQANYPLVKEGTVAAHLTRLSTNNRTRLHHSLRKDGSDDLFFQLGSGQFRLYEAASDPAPIHDESSIPDISTPNGGEQPTSDSSEFAYERDLRNFLAQNLHLIETGLRLYVDEDISGIEFPAGGRYVDILAVDKSGGYVVIELKVSRGYDRAVGQLLRYIGWIEKHHAEPGRKVRGVIVAKDISDDLRLACVRLSDVLLFEYELSVALRLVSL